MLRGNHSAVILLLSSGARSRSSSLSLGRGDANWNSITRGTSRDVERLMAAAGGLREWEGQFRRGRVMSGGMGFFWLVIIVLRS